MEQNAEKLLNWDENRTEVEQSKELELGHSLNLARWIW